MSEYICPKCDKNETESPMDLCTSCKLQETRNLLFKTYNELDEAKKLITFMIDYLDKTSQAGAVARFIEDHDDREEFIKTIINYI
jgi:hypothetical protein